MCVRTVHICFPRIIVTRIKSGCALDLTAFLTWLKFKNLKLGTLYYKVGIIIATLLREYTLFEVLLISQYQRILRTPYVASINQIVYYYSFLRTSKACIK